MIPVGRLDGLAKVVMGQSPSGSNVNRDGQGVPLLNGPTEFTMRSPIPVQWTVVPTKLAHAGDTLFCVRGSTTGRMNIADRDYCVGRGVAAIAAHDPADARYVYYAVSYSLPDLLAGVTGSVFPNLSSKQISSAAIPLPSAGRRRAIAEVLGALDDKIAANAKLEQASRDVRAVALISARVAGTESAQLGSLTAVLSRGKAPRYVEVAAGALAVNQKCVRNGTVSLGPARFAAEMREPQLKVGDILVNSTGQGTLGRVGVWRSSAAAFADSHVTIVRFDPRLVDPWVGAEALLAMESQIESLGEGSTGQTELSRKALSETEVLVPTRRLQAELGARLADLHKREQQASEESAVLSELRDTLLPHLMSGRLSVREAEAQVEEVL